MTEALLARLDALINRWVAEMRSLRNAADWMDGCNGRPFNPQKRRELRVKADERSACVSELSAVVASVGRSPHLRGAAPVTEAPQDATRVALEGPQRDERQVQATPPLPNGVRR